MVKLTLKIKHKYMLNVKFELKLQPSVRKPRLAWNTLLWYYYTSMGNGESIANDLKNSVN